MQPPSRPPGVQRSRHQPPAMPILADADRPAHLRTGATRPRGTGCPPAAEGPRRQLRPRRPASAPAVDAPPLHLPHPVHRLSNSRLHRLDSEPSASARRARTCHPVAAPVPPATPPGGPRQPLPPASAHRQAAPAGQCGRFRRDRLSRTVSGNSSQDRLLGHLVRPLRRSRQSQHTRRRRLRHTRRKLLLHTRRRPRAAPPPGAPQLPTHVMRPARQQPDPSPPVLPPFRERPSAPSHGPRSLAGATPGAPIAPRPPSARPFAGQPPRGPSFRLVLTGQRLKQQTQPVRARPRLPPPRPGAPARPPRHRVSRSIGVRFVLASRSCADLGMPGQPARRSGPTAPSRIRPMHPTTRCGPSRLPRYQPSSSAGTGQARRSPRPRVSARMKREISANASPNAQAILEPPPIDREITVAEGVTVKELSEKLGVKANLVIKKLVERENFRHHQPDSRCEARRRVGA